MVDSVLVAERGEVAAWVADVVLPSKLQARTRIE